ncbi:hypothetical protein KSC_032820 [Ktedonobacter sp. SOSP1-52]|nr:hypothetical protein KSC_032820 [Ktedonobacter sp. SOSP1-52]
MVQILNHNLSSGSSVAHRPIQVSQAGITRTGYGSNWTDYRSKCILSVEKQAGLAVWGASSLEQAISSTV